MKLNLGVVDIAYVVKGEATTTGDVAEILEDNYGVMRTFVELHEQDIADAVGKQLMGMLENAKMGAPMSVDTVVFDDIHDQFAEYLESGEWERTSGQPTQAALSGIRHTHKKTTTNDKGTRPSFVDTGLYKGSMRAWLTK